MRWKGGWLWRGPGDLWSMGMGKGHWGVTLHHPLQFSLEASLQTSFHYFGLGAGLFPLCSALSRFLMLHFEIMLKLNQV